MTAVFVLQAGPCPDHSLLDHDRLTTQRRAEDVERDEFRRKEDAEYKANRMLLGMNPHSVGGILDVSKERDPQHLLLPQNRECV